MMVNIKDVAKKTGFSVATVSKALNGYTDISTHTKNTILKVAGELGYMPNSYGKTLVTKKSFTIGVVFEEQTGIGLSHPFFGEVLSIIKSQIEAHGYDMLLMSKKVGIFVKSYIDHCYQKGVDGVIVISADLDYDNYVRIIESKLPMALIDFENEYKNTVYTNNFKASYDSVMYLYEHGHRKIGYIKGDLNRFTGKERFAGFRKAMEDLNLSVPEEYLYTGSQYLFDEGTKAAGQIADLSDRPTAVICASDTLAIGLMRGLMNLGLKVPDDVSIMGFDDIRIAAQMFPALTTVAQDKKTIGLKASEMLIGQINNPQAPVEHFMVDGIIVERQTVKNLNK
jgi:LacI family transcriptional regulator